MCPVLQVNRNWGRKISLPCELRESRALTALVYFLADFCRLKASITLKMVDTWYSRKFENYCFKTTHLALWPYYAMLCDKKRVHVDIKKLTNVCETFLNILLSVVTCSNRDFCNFKSHFQGWWWQWWGFPTTRDCFNNFFFCSQKGFSCLPKTPVLPRPSSRTCE